MNDVKIDWFVLQHYCTTPGDPGLSKDVNYGARWKCPECKQQWNWLEQFPYSSFAWERKGRPSIRWRRAEAKRVRERNAAV